MTVSYEPLRVPSCRLESPFSWCFFGILLGALELLLPTSSDACGPPPRLNSMKVKGNPATSYKAGDRVKYECRLGYKIIVPPLPTSTVCQADNTWAPPLKEACIRKSCPQLAEPVNGQLSYVNGTLEFGSQVHFTCNDGYYLLGTKILYCELDGKNVAWNEEPPQCEKVFCQPPKKIPNGMYSNSHKDVFEYNEFVTYSCNPSNGSDQYSLVGESRLVCSGRNQWSSDPPECKVIKCEYPVIKNGNLVAGVAKNFYYKSTIRVECLAGFHLEGNSNAVCGLNGTWEPKIPECIKDAPTTVRTTPPTSSKPDACGAPPRLNSMKVKGNPATSYKAGDRVEYECRPGYRIIVPPLPTSTVCQANNTWAPPLKEACKRKSCPQLAEPVNGQLSYVNGTLEFGSQVHFTCNDGYYLLGTKILYCELDGKNVAWNEEPPQCEKVFCQPPKKIPNGMYTNSHKDVFEYNEFVTYSCNPSNGSDQYSLVGESRLVCSGRNQWSSDPPECKVIKCEYPVIKNGNLVAGVAKNFYYKSTIRVECLDGFHLEGNSNAVCGLNGTWEPKIPECIKDATTTVRTTPPTSSKPDACGAPPRLNSMKVKGNPATSYKAGDRVEYECRLGYRIIVPPLPTSTVCQADNTWAPPLKEACIRKSCPQLAEPVNGQLSYVNGTLEFGSQVHFACNDGYYLLGTKILYCELDGKNVAWNEEPPQCEKVFCQPPKKIPNGMYSNSHKDVFEYNEFVTYSCNPSNGSDQYSLVGESRLVCSGRNQWSSDPPECKVIKCEYPVIKNGNLVAGVAKNFYYKSTIRVECLAGFHLEGNSNAVCGLNGTWEPKIPECIKDAPTTVRTTPPTSSKPDACGPPPRLNSMKVKGNPATSYKAGDRVEYECRPGYRIIVPPLPTSTVCQADNSWAPPLKEACKRKSCPQLAEPVNGQLSYVNGTLEFGSQVHFTCNDGYYLLGTKILYCELDGNNVVWSDEPPQCEKIFCQPPKKIPNGMYSNSHKDVFEYNEFVTYSCNPSNGSDQYSLVGESRLVCSGRDQWSSDPPECKVIKCEYPVIKNGKLVAGVAKNFYYKMAIRVECLAGFHLEGKNNAVCGLNSTWEPKIPECIKDATTTVQTTPPTSSKPGVTTTAKSSNQPGGYTSTNESPTKDDLDGTLIAVIVLTVLLGVAVVGSCVYKCLLIRKRE